MQTPPKNPRGTEVHHPIVTQNPGLNLYHNILLSFQVYNNICNNPLNLKNRHQAACVKLA